MPSNASAIACNSSLWARSAASRAAPGSMISRTSKMLRRKSGSDPASVCHARTSGSRMSPARPRQDHGPALGPGVDETLGDEDAGGLANDGPADAQLAAQLALLGQDRRLAAQLTIHDPPADPLDDARVDPRWPVSVGFEDGRPEDRHGVDRIDGRAHLWVAHIIVLYPATKRHVVALRSPRATIVP